MDSIMRRMPSGTKTKEEQARYELRKEIIKAGKEGNSVSEAISKSGVKFNMTQRRNIGKAVASDPRALMFSHLSTDEAQKVLDLSNAEERAIYEPLLKLKKLRAAERMR